MESKTAALHAPYVEGGCPSHCGHLNFEKEELGRLVTALDDRR
jgi:predicted amidohydrolase YtcJ